MVDSIQGNSRVNSVDLTNIQKLKKPVAQALGIFGFGTKSEVVSQNPIDKLSEKFSFKTPEYHKGIPQLEIKDSDYIPDEMFKENAYCEV